MRFFRCLLLMFSEYSAESLRLFFQFYVKSLLTNLMPQNLLNFNLKIVNIRAVVDNFN